MAAFKRSLPCLNQSELLSSHGIRSAAVVGAGQMGTGIALVSARNAQVPVKLFDANPKALDKSLSFLDSLLEKDIKKGKISNQDANQARARVQPVEKLEDLGDVDLVMEAVKESLQVKSAVFAALAQACHPQAILASNTSSISLTRIASCAVVRGAQDDPSQHQQAPTQSPARVVGLHWFNPVPVMKLVELIRPLQAQDEVVDRAKLFAEACGKTVCTSADAPGFVGNRILIPMINEAITLLETNIATKEDIDNTMKLGMAHPMGPLQLADFIGLDTCLSIMQVLLHETGDPKYRPSILLSRMVDAGRLGKKSGQGFYSY